MSDAPIQLQASKWVRGKHDHWLYQKGGGRANNSGPTGRATRFYVGRAFRKHLGKHGINKLHAKKVDKKRVG